MVAHKVARCLDHKLERSLSLRTRLFIELEPNRFGVGAIVGFVHNKLRPVDGSNDRRLLMLPAVQHVVTCTTDDHIVAQAPVDGVVARPGGNETALVTVVLARSLGIEVNNVIALAATLEVRRCQDAKGVATHAQILHLVEVSSLPRARVFGLGIGEVLAHEDLGGIGSAIH
jgi:hypothetical protein